MDDFKDSVKKGFNACKSDIESLKSKNVDITTSVFSLEEENRYLKEKIGNLNLEVNGLKSEIKGLSIAIEYIKDFKKQQEGRSSLNLVQENPQINSNNQNQMFADGMTSSNLNQQVTEFSQIYPVSSNNFTEQIPVSNNPSVMPQVQNLVTHSIPQAQQKPSLDPYEALLAFKAKSNKREILKHKLITMVRDGGMNLSELKFMFVEHFRYCSKATFYNYLKELEFNKSIKIERENSKNYVYLNNSLDNELQ